MKGNCNLLIAKIPFELHFMVIGDIQFTKRNGDILRYCTIHTFSSTFLVFKLNRICKWRWSTIGVNIFVQFSFSGVYLFAGTGICRNSDFTPLSNKRNCICYTSVQIWYLAWTYSRNPASTATNARPPISCIFFFVVEKFGKIVCWRPILQRNLDLILPPDPPLISFVIFSFLSVTNVMMCPWYPYQGHRVNLILYLSIRGIVQVEYLNDNTSFFLIARHKEQSEIKFGDRIVQQTFQVFRTDSMKGMATS